MSSPNPKGMSSLMPRRPPRAESLFERAIGAVKRLRKAGVSSGSGAPLSALLVRFRLLGVAFARRLTRWVEGVRKASRYFRFAELCGVREWRVGVAICMEASV